MQSFSLKLEPTGAHEYLRFRYRDDSPERVEVDFRWRRFGLKPRTYGTKS